MVFKIRGIRCFMIVAIFLGMLIIHIPVSAKTSNVKWKKIDADGVNAAWERKEDKNSVYATTQLYIYRNEIHKVHFYNDEMGDLAGHFMTGDEKIASWKMDLDYQSLRIVTVRGNTAYVQLSTYVESKLYSVNIETKKKKLVSDEFYALPTAAKYIYAKTVNTSDTSACPVNVWKVGNSSIKKVRPLGKYIFEVKAVGKYIYYGKYKSSSQKEVMVYRADLDGSHQKKLFTVKGKGKYVQSYLCGASREKIEVITSINGKNVTYEYNIKTKKIKKITLR